MTLNVLHFHLLPPALYTEHEVIWCGIPFVSVGVSCPTCFPPNPLCTSSLILKRGKESIFPCQTQNLSHYFGAGNLYLNKK